jgi:hypothetical protein
MHFTLKHDESRFLHPLKPMNKGVQPSVKRKNEEKQKHVLEVGENAFSPPSITRFRFTPERVFKTLFTLHQNEQRFKVKASAFCIKRNSVPGRGYFPSPSSARTARGIPIIFANWA